jgi:hypothetical protein
VDGNLLRTEKQLYFSDTKLKHKGKQEAILERQPRDKSKKNCRRSQDGPTPLLRR